MYIGLVGGSHKRKRRGRWRCPFALLFKCFGVGGGGRKVGGIWRVVRVGVVVFNANFIDTFVMLKVPGKKLNYSPTHSNGGLFLIRNQHPIDFITVSYVLLGSVFILDLIRQSVYPNRLLARFLVRPRRSHDVLQVLNPKIAFLVLPSRT